MASTHLAAWPWAVLSCRLLLSNCSVVGGTPGMASRLAVDTGSSISSCSSPLKGLQQDTCHVCVVVANCTVAFFSYVDYWQDSQTLKELISLFHTHNFILH